MSGHETIRVLEVGVDAQIPAEEEGKALEAVGTEGSQSGGPASVPLSLYVFPSVLLSRVLVSLYFCFSLWVPVSMTPSLA